jgi:hypothetical protein
MKNLIGASLIAFAVCGCNSNANPQPPDASNKVASEQPHKPSFATKDGQDYGYVRALTDDDKQKGVAGSAVVMFRFFGAVGSKYQVGTQTTRGSFVVFEGEAPFEFVKAYSFFDNRLIEKETLRMQPNAIARLALEDARHGSLQQYRATRDGKPGRLMFDEQVKRLIFVSDAQ